MFLILIQKWTNFLSTTSIMLIWISWWHNNILPQTTKLQLIDKNHDLLSTYRRKKI